MFGELAVNTIDSNDWLSIVTFSDSGVIDFPMERMSHEGKKKAKDAIGRLDTRDNTNLESGMMKALEAIREAPRMDCRDCIVVFTDGEANQGDLEADSLVKKYNDAQRDMNRKSCIPVSAFTIGSYRPHLLVEISRNLGSESFYWLDQKQDFETDMLIPVFLREETCISDVEITMKARSNCYFEPFDLTARYFTGVSTSKVSGQTEEKPTTQTFFIHSLPKLKNMKFGIQVSDLEDLSNRRVVEISVTYLDRGLESRKIKDYIFLSTSSLKTSLMLDPKATNMKILNNDVLSDVSAFVTANNQTRMSWSDARESIVTVTRETCRYIIAASIKNAKVFVKDDPSKSQLQFEKGCKELDIVTTKATIILALCQESVDQINSINKKWKQQLVNAQKIVAQKDNETFSLLCSMESSISAESPVGRGVFAEQQPYMDRVLEIELEKQDQCLRDILKLRYPGMNEAVYENVERVVEEFRFMHA